MLTERADVKICSAASGFAVAPESDRLPQMARCCCFFFFSLPLSPLSSFCLSLFYPNTLVSTLQTPLRVSRPVAPPAFAL